jgi:hypothetical protein
MTSVLQFIDASTPLEEWPAETPEHNPIDGIGFYIGGDTPHVWSLVELESCPYRYRLPLYVASDMTNRNAVEDAGNAIVALKHTYGAPLCVLGLDTETGVDPEYVKAFYNVVNAAGYTLLDYGSNAYVFGNDIPNGYYWAADWLNPPERTMARDSVGTQYQSLTAYDEDIMSTILPYWDTHVVNPEVPPGQWHNPDQWSWRSATITGVGLNGTTYTFTFNPNTGLWMGPT